MCFSLFSCLKVWWKPGRLLTSYYTFQFYQKNNINLFKFVAKMHDNLLFPHYLHCIAYQYWRPGFPKAIYSTGNTSRKNLLLFFSPHFIDDTLNTRAECVRDSLMCRKYMFLAKIFALGSMGIQLVPSPHMRTWSLWLTSFDKSWTCYSSW